MSPCCLHRAARTKGPLGLLTWPDEIKSILGVERRFYRARNRACKVGAAPEATLSRALTRVGPSSLARSVEDVLIWSNREPSLRESGPCLCACFGPRPPTGPNRPANERQTCGARGETGKRNGQRNHEIITWPASTQRLGGSCGRLSSFQHPDRAGGA